MKRLLVLGAGESGVGTALLAQSKGYEVFVSDFGIIQKTYKDVLLNNEIQWEEGGHNLERILQSDVVVKSPGIPSTVPVVKAISKAGIDVISEIEFASWFTSATLVGITGSNGKTTTASLTYALLNSSLNVGLSGNIGDSFAKQLLKYDYSNYVLEISSFQLDDIKSFKPDRKSVV